MQIIFQEPHSSLDDNTTVKDIIEEPLVITKMCRSKQERRKKVTEMMDSIGLAVRYLQSYPHKLDGGRRQRIGIASVLAVNLRLIVCDEPVSVLDVSIQTQILNLMMSSEVAWAYLYLHHTQSCRGKAHLG